MTSSLWWFVSRGSGLVLLVTLSAALVLGLLARARRCGGAASLALQSLHRAMALLGLLLLTVHVATVVVDSYVDIRWWDAVVPALAAYRPVPLGLGTLALDLVLLAAVTGLLRARLPEGVWRSAHALVFPAWVVAVVHGLVLGPDASARMGRGLVLACTASVALAAVVSFGPRAWGRRTLARASR